MISRTECSKCGSHKIIPDVRIDDRTQGRISELTIRVPEDPGAFLFKGTHLGTVTAWVCGTCGFMELYVDNPEELYAAYEKRPQ